MIKKLNLLDSDIFAMFKHESQQENFELNYILVLNKSEKGEREKNANQDFVLSDGIKNLYQRKETMMMLIGNLSIIFEESNSDQLTKLINMKPEI